MVVECPYILIPYRTQLSGPRFPQLTLFTFNGLAGLLSQKPLPIARKWDYLSHLRTSRRPPSPPSQGGTSVRPNSFSSYCDDGRLTQAEFCREESSTPAMN